MGLGRYTLIGDPALRGLVTEVSVTAVQACAPPAATAGLVVARAGRRSLTPRQPV
jgi:hypothetical protein